MAALHILLLLIFVGASFCRAATLEQFGLRHTLIGGAALTNIYGHGLGVDHLNLFGDGGVSTELGEADSGAFIYPYTGSVSEGYFMRGRAFGSVDGRPGSVIGTLSGRREDYATFFISADFSAIGATNLTFQLWNGDRLLREHTGSASDEIRLFTESFSSPRANPWRRDAAGAYGASIEFRSASLMTLPNCPGSSCPFVYADRIFIRPNGATSVVDFVSRVDTFGGGGLPDFNINGMFLGMFHRPHAFLGSGRFVATNGTLTIAEIPAGGEEGGVLVEFDMARRANVTLRPIQLSPPVPDLIERRIDVTSSGTVNHSFAFAGTLSISSSNGSTAVGGNFSEELFTTLRVYSNDVLVGSGALAATENVRINGTPGIVSAGATSDTVDDRAGIFIGFETNATFTFSNGVQLAGNRVAMHANRSVGLVDVTGVSIVARDIPSFTIVGESSQRIAAPVLEITRSGTNVLLRWPDPAQGFYLAHMPFVDDSFSGLEIPNHYTNGVASVFFPISERDTSFFKLALYSHRYGD